MSLGHEHGLVLIGLAGPMDAVNLSLSLSLSRRSLKRGQTYEVVYMVHVYGWQH